ncbi:MAG TPA: HAMP domain-containing sensor histidine kinase, partial [Polyangiales bacterium]|nr:HAMP domain-containing sensor histidine kinase [Polyangiales bacterium]
MNVGRTSLDVDVNSQWREWSSDSPFGPPSEWPLALKTLVPLVLRNPQPALLFWGPNLRVLYNDACRSWLGSKHPGAIGAPASEVWADVWETLGPTIERVVSTGEGACSEPVALTLSGNVLVAPSQQAFGCTPAFDEQGAIAGVLLVPANAFELAVGHRIGPRAFAELELRERLLAERELLLSSELAAKAEAEAANRAKDEFLAMLGHELRNPLSPILTALGLMRLRGERSREHAVIERQVGHLVRLVDDLLDVSRITRGKIELRRAPIELSSVVQRAVEIASPLLERRNQRLEMAVPEFGLVVDADADRLAQVVANL